MRKCCLLIVICFATMLCYSQESDSTSKSFSNWILRFNPFSFFEPVGGAQVGIETNLDAKKKFYLVSEYGYIFLNSFKMYSDAKDDKRNNGHISGFEIKQEIRMTLQTRKNPGISFIAVEINYLNAKVNNSGWFAMGNPDAFGLYPYFKYQDFQETTSETSMALKYVLKSFPNSRKFNIEGFIGFGFTYKDYAYKKAEGILVQPDLEPIFDTNKKGLSLYVPIGLRLLFKLR